MNRDPRSLDPLALPLHQYVMLDTETTGLDPRTGARLLEIGMARVENDHVAEVFDTLVNPTVVEDVSGVWCAGGGVHGVAPWCVGFR